MPLVSLCPGAGAFSQFFTTGGFPLNAGLLYSYIAGGTTPQATYTTSAGNVQNSNPIVLGADGRPPNEIWIIGEDSYRFDLKDSLGNLIKTYDNISANAGSWTFLQAGTGAVSRTIQSKERDFVSLLDFGADNTGSADCSAALQDAIDSVSSGGWVYVPPGIYRLNSDVALNQNFTGIRGAGYDSTYFQYYGTGYAISVTAGIRCDLSGFRMTDTGGTGLVGVSFKYTAATTSFQHSCRDVHITGFTAAGFQNLNSEQFIGEHIYVLGSVLGFDISQATHTGGALGINNRYTECRAIQCTSDGWDVQSQQNCSFINCEGLQCTAPRAQFRLRGTCRSCHIIGLDVENTATSTVGLLIGGDGHTVQILGFQLATGISLESATTSLVLPGVYSSVTTPINIAAGSTDNTLIGTASITESSTVTGRNTRIGKNMLRESLKVWVADDAQNPSLGTLPANSYVLSVALQVTEAFNSDGTDTISVGYDGAETAYITATDVSTTGIKSPTGGSLMGYNDTARAVEAYYVNGGSEPTTGKAIVILEFYRVANQIA